MTQAYDPAKRAEAQFMCATVCEHYALSPESTKVALKAAGERYQGSHACYRAILNSLTWGTK